MSILPKCLCCESLSFPALLGTLTPGVIQNRTVETVFTVQTRPLPQPDMAGQDEQETAHLAVHRPARWEPVTRKSYVSHLLIKPSQAQADALT